LTKAEAERVADLLASCYPNAECALVHENIWELLISVVLSAQTTDVSVNKVTPELFEKWPDACALAIANPNEVETVLKRIGMYRTKAANIIKLSDKLCAETNGEVPCDYDYLISLPGVGRKTANVVLSVGFGEQRIAVDTHVFRLANRIGLTDEKDVLKTEEALMKILPHDRWSEAHHSLIWHGRQVCHARKPDCAHCVIREICRFNPDSNNP
jgi:endonuclease-3